MKIYAPHVYMYLNSESACRFKFEIKLFIGKEKIEIPLWLTLAMLSAMSSIPCRKKCSLITLFRRAIRFVFSKVGSLLKLRSLSEKFWNEIQMERHVDIVNRHM